jgi:hypothetical protein
MGNAKRTPSKVTQVVSLGFMAAAASGLQACEAETSERASQSEAQADSAMRAQLHDPDAIEAVRSAPAAHATSFADLGHTSVLRAFDGAEMAVPLPDEVSGEAAARLHMLRYRDELGLSEEAIEGLRLQNEHKLPAGAAIYQFTQHVHDLPVFQSRAKLVLDGRKNLISLANGLAPSWLTVPGAAEFKLSGERALIRAYVASGGPELLLGAIRESIARANDFNVYKLTTPVGDLGIVDASTRKVMFAEETQLVSAYQVEITTRSPQTFENQSYRYVIAADDGRVLYRASITANEAFNYRVFADTTGLKTPMDGPIKDATPHPTSIPDGFQPAWAESVLVPMEGFNKHTDPWLPADATYSFGNNVRAYSDRNQANAFIFTTGSGFQDGADFRAETTAPKTFDRIYNPMLKPDASEDQIKASVTQVFYVTNWLHDYFYDSGFDEASGNGQEDNLGRGGQAADPLLVEAQDSADGGRANNANMSTPGDGSSPRMQMYVWTGTPNTQLATNPPLQIDDAVGSASFGPQKFDLKMGELVLSKDGSTQIPAGATGAGMGSETDACQRPTNVMGKIAVVDRGVCNFANKVTNAQTAGAIAVLLINNAAGHTAPNLATQAQGVTIPVLTMSLEDGQRLKARLLEGPLQVMTFMRGEEIGRDGSIDSTVVAHEWGHYLHMRLQDGQSQQYGGMSEGWGDFNSLFMVVREGDRFPGRAFPMAQYAAAGFGSRAAYFGIRRAPYSVEYTINPFTFGHIRTEADLPKDGPVQGSEDDPMNEVHVVGEIWAQTLFDVYVNILESGAAAGRKFDENKRRMADYMVAALKAAPDDPTFVEQRDAFMSVARAMVAMDPTRQADVQAMARGFAKRGLGAGAVAPPKRSTSLNEAVESFVVLAD